MSDESLVARLRSRALHDGKAGLSGGSPVCAYDRALLLEAADALDARPPGGGVEREQWIRERAEEIVRIHAGCIMKCGLCQQTEDALVEFAHELLHADAAHPRAVPSGYSELQMQHARKQENANGFQKGWHAVLRRIREGADPFDLRELVPEPAAASPVEAQGWQTIHTCKVCGAECNC